MFGEFGNRGIQETREEDENEKSNEEHHENEDVNEVGNVFDSSNRLENTITGAGTQEAEISSSHGQVQLRRLERQTNRPKYPEDYVLLAEEEGERLLLCPNNEPRNFGEAMGSKDWMLACEDEINSIKKNETWSLDDLPLGTKRLV